MTVHTTAVGAGAGAVDPEHGDQMGYSSGMSAAAWRDQSWRNPSLDLYECDFRSLAWKAVYPGPCAFPSRVYEGRQPDYGRVY